MICLSPNFFTPLYSGIPILGCDELTVWRVDWFPNPRGEINWLNNHVGDHKNPVYLSLHKNSIIHTYTVHIYKLYYYTHKNKFIAVVDLLFLIISVSGMY